jgi:CRP-like cAMP-binding protein
MSLKRSLVTVIFGDSLRRVPLFALLHSHWQDESFLVEVWSYMKYNTYNPGTAIVEMGEPAHRLLVVVSGEMTVFVENEDEGKDSYILKPGDYIGDYALLDDTNWSASTLISTSCSSEAHVEVYTADTHFLVCLELEAAAFQTIVEAHSFHMVSTISHLKRLRTEHTTPTGGVIFRTFQVMARWERLINALLIAGDSVPDSARTSAGSFRKRVQRHLDSVRVIRQPSVEPVKNSCDGNAPPQPTEDGLFKEVDATRAGGGCCAEYYISKQSTHAHIHECICPRVHMRTLNQKCKPCARLNARSHTAQPRELV